MDFIVDLPPSQACTTIMVVVDRCTKMSHFIPTSGLPTAQKTSELFLQHVFRLHGLSDSIVSDRGAQFTSRFWTQFCRSLHITRSLSSAYHPQSNGQTERTNQTLEQFLRCYTSHLQDDWVSHLPFAEFSFNNQLHSSTGLSPFYANYGYHPATLPDLPLDVPVPEVAQRLWLLRELRLTLTQQLQAAQQRHKTQADRRRTEFPRYKDGDKVWLSTQHLKLSCPSRKLGPRYLGPFEIVSMVNNVAAKLQLPTSLGIHPVFHVSLLKPHRANPFPDRAPAPPPPIQVNNDDEYEVQEILDSRRRRGVLEYLIHWKGYGPEERSWEPLGNVHAAAKVRAFHRAHPERPSQGRVRRPLLGGGLCQEAGGVTPTLGPRARRRARVPLQLGRTPGARGAGARRVRSTQAARTFPGA